ncbi:hypothetical protein CHU98_g3424 [Xylaria longipes]|nr:hypothetical protein CHU98_g3424 [Xylaria longipes]
MLPVNETHNEKKFDGPVGQSYIFWVVRDEHIHNSAVQKSLRTRQGQRPSEGDFRDSIQYLERVRSKESDLDRLIKLITSHQYQEPDKSKISDRNQGSGELKNQGDSSNLDDWNQSGSKANQATSFPTARQKVPTYPQTTISDDRSRGSEFDHDNQLLVAIRSSSTAEKAQSQEIVTENHTKANQSLPSDDPAPESPSSAIPVLRILKAEEFDILGDPARQFEDYKEQLRILVEHNKRRLMIASQAQGRISHGPPSEPLTSNTLVREINPSPDLHYTDEDRSLDNALRIIRRHFNIEDESLLTIEALWDYTSKIRVIQAYLQPRVQLIHRVSKNRMYLDPPQWLAEASLSGKALDGNFPVPNVSSYLSKHPEIICIVYWDYDDPDTQDSDYNPDAYEQPKHSSEVIEPDSEALATAINAFRDYFTFGVDNETVLSSPYFPIFHTRGTALSSFSETLDSKQRQHFHVFLDYILTQYEAEYKLVDYMTRLKRLLVHKLASTSVINERRGGWFWKCRIRHLVSYHEANERGLQDSGRGRYMIDMKMYQDLHKREVDHLLSKPRGDLGPKVLKQNDPPGDNFIYLTPPTIKGFSLKRKKWLDLEVDKFEPVTWNKQAFKHLVIKERKKRLIQALISNQIEAEKSTDLITGKGSGLVMLLHGGPGTGKTLTAESVAEIAEKPLCPVTCGDIGSKPEEVER